MTRHFGVVNITVENRGMLVSSYFMGLKVSVEYEIFSSQLLKYLCDLCRFAFIRAITVRRSVYFHDATCVRSQDSLLAHWSTMSTSTQRMSSSFWLWYNIGAHVDDDRGQGRKGNTMRLNNDELDTSFDRCPRNVRCRENYHPPRKHPC